MVSFGWHSATLNVNTTSLTVGGHSVSVTVSGTCGSVTKSATLNVQANTTTTDHLTLLSAKARQRAYYYRIRDGAVLLCLEERGCGSNHWRSHYY